MIIKGIKNLFYIIVRYAFHTVRLLLGNTIKTQSTFFVTID